MKLLEAYIENFGKLSQFSFHFSDGINVICEDNGWGKTTFAAFIKAMLYGLPASRSKDLFENERARYMPWQGGVFGGWLSFEVKGKAYRIERRFEAKSAQDTFTLSDLSTNTPTDAYPDAPGGVALFGIDAAGFERSTYISERSDYVKADYSDVQAKLVNLGDFEDCDKAIKKLEERRRFYRPSSTRGELVELRKQLSALEEELHHAEIAAREYAIAAEKQRALRQEQRELMEQSQATHNELDRLHRGQLEQTCREQLSLLGEAVERAKKDLADAVPVALSAEEIGQVETSVQYLIAKNQEKTKAEEAEPIAHVAAPEKSENANTLLPIGITLIGFALLLMGILFAGLRLPMLILGGVLVVIGAWLWSKNAMAKNATPMPADHTPLSATPEVDEAEENAKEVLSLFLLAYPIPDTPSPSLDAVMLHLHWLKDQKATYQLLQTRVEDAEQAQKDYAAAHPIIGGDIPATQDDEETLQARYALLSEKQHELVNVLRVVDSDVATLATKAQTLPELEQSVADTKEKLAIAEENYAVIVATISYLEQAKAELTAGYLCGVQDKFSEYVSLMDCLDKELASKTFTLTPSFEVNVQSMGQSHDSITVSRGTRDLLALCLRLALSDAIFEGEVPPLILDDPFVSFDIHRIKTALSCLHTMAQKRQMIYFTCHQSRAPKQN